MDKEEFAQILKFEKTIPSLFGIRVEEDDAKAQKIIESVNAHKTGNSELDKIIIKYEIEAEYSEKYGNRSPSFELNADAKTFDELASYAAPFLFIENRFRDFNYDEDKDELTVYDDLYNDMYSLDLDFNVTTNRLIVKLGGSEEVHSECYRYINRILDSK